MDVDKNGLVNYTELISDLIDYKKYIKKENLIEYLNIMTRIKVEKFLFKNFQKL